MENGTIIDIHVWVVAQKTEPGLGNHVKFWSWKMCSKTTTTGRTRHQQSLSIS